MKSIPITAVRKASYPDLMAKYEPPHPARLRRAGGANLDFRGCRQADRFLRQRLEQHLPFCHDPGPRGQQLL